MKKQTALLLLAMIACVSSCSPYSIENNQNISKPISASPVAMPFANQHSIPKPFLLSPQRSWESDVFLVGWKISNNVGYDISLLSQKEKHQIIENGIKALICDADKEENAKTNRTMLANYFYAKQDFKKAIYWSLKGVESGSASCMQILSVAHLNGEQGVPQDYEEGLKWAFLGAACGNKSCKTLVDTNTIEFALREDLRDLILASQRKATAWMKEHPRLFAARDEVDERII